MHIICTLVNKKCVRYDHSMSQMSTYLGHLVRRLHQQSTAIFSEGMANAGYDITPMQFAALKGIKHNENIDQASLAEFVACDRATMGGIIDRLEKKKLLVRKVSPTDRRARILSLSESGEAMISELEPIVDVFQNLIGGNLSSIERQQLESLLIKALSSSKIGKDFS